MISVKCPHCHVGLKVDEGKLPLGLPSFKCPKCKQSVPVSLLGLENHGIDGGGDTVLVHPSASGAGRLLVVGDGVTAEQMFPLHEGVFVVGRKSDTSGATISIETADKSMSREHIRIEVRKDHKGGYKHYLSDNNSKNHTLYNGNYLEDGEVVVLKDDDEIIIGHTVLRFKG